MRWRASASANMIAHMCTVRLTYQYYDLKTSITLVTQLARLCARVKRGLIVLRHGDALGLCYFLFYPAAARCTMSLFSLRNPRDFTLDSG